MNLQSLINDLVGNTVDTSIPLFLPELVLCGTIVVLLVTRLFPGVDRIPTFLIAVAGAAIALWAALPQEGLATWRELEPVEIFTGMLTYDSVTAFMRVFLMAFAVLFVVLIRLTGLADRYDGQDVYCLVFGATIGMSIMASSNHLLSLFLGVEMASVPSYVLAGVVKGRRRSSEASLKYAVYGAGTAGVMLYGVSLLAGVLNSAHFPTMAMRLAELDIPAKLAGGEETLTVMVLALGGLMLGVGLAFKLSAVPFHFWCPDVFEGASAEVNGFLSVASKAAALALLIRVGIGFGYSPHEGTTVLLSPIEEASQTEASDGAATLRFVANGQVAAERKMVRQLAPVRHFMVMLIALVAVVTCTFGNLAAYGQTNIKRMLAYSTIAHAGYMMMPVAAAIALLGESPEAAEMAISTLLLYAGIYFFMNLGVFAIVAFVRNSIHSEEIRDYAGLIRSAPMTAVSLTLILFSLVGLPPLAGFVGKFRIFQALVEAGGPLMIFLLVAAGLNTAISLVYYLRVAKTACIDPEPDTARPAQLGFLSTTYVAVVTAPVVLLGILPGILAPWAEAATQGLFR